MQIACYIEDDAAFNRVQGALNRDVYECVRFGSHTSLVRSVRRRPYQMVLMAPGRAFAHAEILYPWLQCCASERLPIVVLCEALDTQTAIRALEAGADDVLYGEFEPMELKARIGAVLRRYRQAVGSKVIEMHGFRLDHAANSLHDCGVPIPLTPKEFELAWLLFSFPGQSISREKIGLAVWGSSCDICSRTLEQHLYKLRKKLQLTKKRGIWIQTIYGDGVVLRMPEGGMAEETPSIENQTAPLYSMPVHAIAAARMSA